MTIESAIAFGIVGGCALAVLVIIHALLELGERLTFVPRRPRRPANRWTLPDERKR